MRFIRHLALVAGLAGVLLGGKPAAAQTTQHVEFSEVNLTGGTDLTGSAAFSAYGLSFQNTFYVVDSRLSGAGADNRGIATVGTGTVQFASDVSGLTVSTARLLSGYVATVRDVNNNVLQTLTLPNSGTSNPVYAQLAFTGISGIRSLQFSDGAGGGGAAIGRLDYTLAPAAVTPEPSTAALLLPALGGLPLCGLWRKKRGRVA